TLVSVTPMGNDFQYTYEAMLTGNTSLHTAGGGSNTQNFFTLYDIQGLVAGSETYGGALATNTTHSEQLTGITPVTETPVPPDNASVLNITTFWTGADVTGPFDMGTFSFLSTSALGSALLAYTAASQKTEGFPDSLANNTGQVAGPGPSVSPV